MTQEDKELLLKDLVTMKERNGKKYVLVATCSGNDFKMYK